MPLLLKSDEKESANRKSFVFTEKTLAYSASNIGGWGAPNADLGDVLNADLFAFKRNEDGLFVASTPVSIDMMAILPFPGFPSSAEKSTTILASTFGYGTEFADGIYRFSYSVRVDAGIIGIVIYTSTNTKIFIGNINCCFLKKTLKFKNCLCDNAQYRCFLMQYNLLKYAITEFEGGTDNLDEVQRLIDLLTNMCADDDCGCN